jgi:hypothetical protein
MENQLVKQQNNLQNIYSLDSQKAFLQNLIDSGQLPTYIKKIETAYTIAQYGKELGFAPMTAFNYVISIQGKLTLSAKAKQAILRRNGITWKTIEDEVYLYADGSVEERAISKLDSKGNTINPNDKRTTIEMTRDGITETYKFYWSDGVKAGLTDKAVWKSYPKAMMYSRCFTALADRVASDLMMGFYSTEEMTDVYGVDETLIVRNDKGEILNIIESEFTVED